MTAGQGGYSFMNSILAFFVWRDDRTFWFGTLIAFPAALVGFLLLLGCPGSLLSAPQGGYPGDDKPTSPGPITSACAMQKQQQLQKDCEEKVASYIKSAYADLLSGKNTAVLPRTYAAQIERLCSIVGDHHINEEGWLVGEGEIKCSVVQNLSARTLAYRSGVMTARAAFPLTILLGLIMFASVAAFTRCVYSTRRALHWLYVGNHP